MMIEIAVLIISLVWTYVLGYVHGAEQERNKHD